MVKEERFYAFIIAHTSRSRSRIQRIRIERKTVTTAVFIAFLITAGAVYGIYGLTQQAAHLKTAFENQRLREENSRQRQELEKLNNRVEKVEDTSRKLAEKSGVVTESPSGGAGGPALPLDEHALDALQAKMNRLERTLKRYESVLRGRGYTPTIWPVEGTLEGGFGGDFLKGGLTVGLNYYASFKVSDDHIEGFPDILIRGKNKTFALGPEVDLALARGGTLYGFLKVNYQWETFARVAPQGSELTIMATFLVKPIKLP